MPIKLANNATTTTVDALTDTSTQIVVAAGTGSKFPVLQAGDYFYATLTDIFGNYEIVRVNTRVVDTLTVTRAQEGTTARAFPANSRIELRITAQSVLDALSTSINYLGASATNPATRPDGTAVVVGDFYFNTVDNQIRVYNGSAWIGLAASSLTRDDYTGNGSTTTFTLSLAPSDETNTQVYINGVYQEKGSYSVSGTSLIFSVAPPVGASVEVITLENVGIATAALVGYLPAGSGAVATNVQAKLRETVSVKDFGAVGDGVADDSTAIQNALNYWKSNGCDLVFPEATSRYRIASGVFINMSGVASVGSIIMTGSIFPDAGIGRAIHILNVRGGVFEMRVFGGGQTANYSVADPVGADEAFVFANAYGSKISCFGQEYAGRVLRVTSDLANIGVDGFKTQWVEIDKIYCNSSAKITDPEATRLAKGVGQAFFIDSQTNAFGSIGTVYILWDTYGPVIESTTDVTLHDMETLFRGVSGFELRGVISFWGGTLKLGSEKVGGGITLLKVIPNGPKYSQGINIDSLFCVGGYNGIYAEDVGVAAGPGLSIKSIVTRLSENVGILLNNCRKFNLDQAVTYGDLIGLRLQGASFLGNISIQALQSKRQAIIVDASVSGQIFFTGSASNGNTDLAANTPLIEVNTLSSIFFNDFVASSGNVDYLYKNLVGSLLRIEGGQVVLAGSTQIYLNQPNRAINVIGWTTENRGSAVIPDGGTSIVVNHNLKREPDYILLTGRSVYTSACFASNVTATQFTINVPSAVVGTQSVNWRAWLNYAG